ncbi:ABC transporter ATP-binding protein [Chelativorans sp. AA-79]|uniref:ABC transporter ATP-binding protein n=1 Tax=Chelativorans sp. AA-79 TaxID=3028735 RepID=UPI0023F61F21|nr:ABC transporter ATP-binding protein [Chelativorans sp. AA-79]WEX08905.1 ABC transporter ATP-binding protein [Chelativorans sp. AA-79]
MSKADRASGSSDLALSGIDKTYGSIRAVVALDLHIEAGALVALLGPSGCGKTTTLRMVAGFERPDSGEIRIGGEDVTHTPSHRRGLGMVFQNYSLFPHRTVAENIAFGLRMVGASRAEQQSEVARMLDMIRLGGREDMYPAQLSGGQQQRVALARSLVVNPRVLLLDEPLGALDRSLRESMQFEIRELQQRMGITTLLVTHDQEEALSMSDRVAVMNAGQILQIGAPSEIYDRPKTRFVAEFLGTSNIFEGRIEDGALLAGRHRVALPPHDGASAPVLSVRPERIVLGPDAERCDTHLKGTISGAVFRGTYAAYQLRVAGLGCDVFVYRQADGPLGAITYRIGEEHWLGWNAEDGVLVTAE